MFRGPLLRARRPFVRRPRLILGALLAGTGYAFGRSSGRRSDEARRAGAPDLDRLVELHAQGELTDDEFAAAKRKLLGL